MGNVCGGGGEGEGGEGEWFEKIAMFDKAWSDKRSTKGEEVALTEVSFSRRSKRRRAGK